jgi:hypothetical protein
MQVLDAPGKHPKAVRMQKEEKGKNAREHATSLQRLKVAVNYRSGYLKQPSGYGNRGGVL